MSEKNRILDLTDASEVRVRTAAWVISALFVSTVIYHLRSVISNHINQLSYPIILGFSLVLMFTSRVRGVLADLKVMKRAFTKAPSYVFPWVGNVFLVAYSFTFSLMVYIYNESFMVFYAAAIAFWIINWIFWLVLRPYLTKIIEASSDHYHSTASYVSREHCNIFHEFISESWIRDRHNFVLVGIVLIGVLNIPTVERWLMDLTGITVGKFFASMAFFALVLVTEGYIWTKRLKRKYRMSYIEKLNERGVIKW